MNITVTSITGTVAQLISCKKDNDFDDDKIIFTVSVNGTQKDVWANAIASWECLDLKAGMIVEWKNHRAVVLELDQLDIVRGVKLFSSNFVVWGCPADITPTGEVSIVPDPADDIDDAILMIDLADNPDAIKAVLAMLSKTFQGEEKKQLWERLTDEQKRKLKAC
jgi:hypothetical protein